MAERDTETQQALSAEELQAEDASALPDRQEMSLISGNLMPSYATVPGIDQTVQGNPPLQSSPTPVSSTPVESTPVESPPGTAVPLSDA
jgi:hypothetical protein